MELSPGPSDEFFGPEYFRVYSDRVHDSHTFVWNPTMDLLATLSGGEESSMSVHRLIPEEDEPNLFHEQLPFPPQSVCWHPSGRELAVGDIQGNIFILTAEPEDERRIHEIQKLHGRSVASLQWVHFDDTHGDPAGVSTQADLLPSSFYSYAKLPAFKDGKVASRPNSLLASLSCSGHVAFLVDGWLPIADIRLPRAEETAYLEMAVEPDGNQAVVLAREPTNAQSSVHDYIVYIIDTRAMIKNKTDIILQAEVERDALGVLKELHDLNEDSARLLRLIDDDFFAKIDASEVSALATMSDLIKTRIDDLFSVQKLVKWEKHVTDLLDRMMVNAFVKLELLADKFLMIGFEIKTSSPASSTVKLSSVAEAVKSAVSQFADSIRLKYHGMKAVFSIIGDVLAFHDFGRSASFISILNQCLCGFSPLDTTPLKDAIKNAELAILQVMTCQREKNSSHIELVTFFRITNADHSPSLAWKPVEFSSNGSAFLLELLWTTCDRSLLHVARIFPSSSVLPPRVFKAILDMASGQDEEASRNARWLQYASYRDNEICVCVGHPNSVCLVTVTCEKEVLNLADLSTEAAAFRHNVEDLSSQSIKAQQLPSDFPADCPTSICVSTTRRLASIFASRRLLTIDLEPEEELDIAM